MLHKRNKPFPRAHIYQEELKQQTLSLGLQYVITSTKYSMFCKYLSMC